MDEEIDESAIVVTNVYGDFCVRKSRRKRQKAIVQEMFYDYANNTTLHGLSYTTKRGLTLIEKVFWLITFIASFCLCSYLISNVWVKWKTSPVIVTVNEKLVPVREVPFPSVTICPQSKSKATVYNYTHIRDELQNELSTDNVTNFHLYESNCTKFADVSNVCGNFLIHSKCFDIFHRRYSDAMVAIHIKDVAPVQQDIIVSCTFRGVDCSGDISTVLTSEGLCFNFNSLSAHDIMRHKIPEGFIFTANKPNKSWSLEHGYSDYGADVYPASGKANGAVPDLTIEFQDILEDRDPMCNGINSGYRVFVQHPADLPQSSLYYYAVLNNQVSNMALSFSALNTSETLRDYDPEIRQCYFEDERYLKFFKIYTAHNCRIECLTNLTLSMCKCVGFYMPRDNNTVVCTIHRKYCMTEALNNVLDTNDTCQCLPGCNSVEYGAEILKTDFNVSGVLKYTFDSFKIENGDEFINYQEYSKLEMYFKQPRFVSMRRSELFGVTDFLSNIGGLLSLFLGFSFLSLVELFYFVTLRLWCTLKKDLKEEKLQRKNTMPIKY